VASPFAPMWFDANVFVLLCAAMCDFMYPPLCTTSAAFFPLFLVYLITSFKPRSRVYGASSNDTCKTVTPT
jgi:hypothetical protein